MFSIVNWRALRMIEIITKFENTKKFLLRRKVANLINHYYNKKIFFYIFRATLLLNFQFEGHQM